MTNINSAEPSRLGNLLLQAGVALIKSGAGSSRVVSNLTRFAMAYGYEANIDMGTRNISISLHEEDQDNVFSGSRSISTLPGANFRVVSAISKLSWDVMEETIPLDRVEERLIKAKEMPTYNRYLVLGLVGVAGAAFCFTFGGNATEMGITFAATFTGLFFKQELVRKKFNPFLVTYASAVLSAAVIGIFWTLGIDSELDHAFATCILFLIPGVLMINSFIDLLDGYITNGIDRGVNALMHAFSIASGLATVLYIFGAR
jgi:uncharacterized membrane protein YjjP (DUF1212 family)